MHLLLWISGWRDLHRLSVRDAAGNRATAVRKVIIESAPSVEISAIRVIGNDMLATILVEGQAEEYDHWHYQLGQALSVSGPAGGTRGEPDSQLLLSGLPLASMNCTSA